MREIRILTSIELRALFGLNTFLHTRDKKAKNRYRLLGVVWVLLLLMAASYTGGLVYGLCLLDLQEIVPAYLVLIAGLLIFAFGLFKAGQTIFSPKRYDLLISLPVRPASIVISRFIILYLEDLLLGTLILLPGSIAYGLLQHPEPLFYLIAWLGMMLLPAIPLAVSVLFGTLIYAVSARMRRKSLVQTGLSLILVLTVLSGSFFMADPQNMPAELTLEQLTGIAKTIGEWISKVCPPAAWLGKAMIHADAGALCLYVLISVTAAALTLLLVICSFHAVFHGLQRVSAKHDYKIGAMESRSLLKALFIREAKRYFSSSIYVTNTIIGPIMGCIMTAALCITGFDAIQTILPPEIDPLLFLPLAVSGVSCMMTTTCSSISMEGKQIDVIKSLPIPVRAWLDSKILLDLCLRLPSHLLSSLVLIFTLRPDLPDLLWILIVPPVITLFSVVFGITVNLRFHSFDWDKEEVIVKQSFSAALGGFAGPLLSLLIGVFLFLTPPPFIVPVQLSCCLLLIAMTLLLYRKNNRARMDRL